MGRPLTAGEITCIVESITLHPEYTVATTAIVAITWIALVYSLQN